MLNLLAPCNRHGVSASDGHKPLTSAHSECARLPLTTDFGAQASGAQFGVTVA